MPAGPYGQTRADDLVVVRPPAGVDDAHPTKHSPGTALTVTRMVVRQVWRAPQLLVPERRPIPRDVPLRSMTSIHAAIAELPSPASVNSA